MSDNGTETGATHERFDRDQPVRGSSDRTFGFVFVVVFVAIGLWPLVGGGAVRLWSLALAVAILAVALARPGLLAPFNRAWMRFGLALHGIVNPVVMGLIFYLAVTPTALVMRALGKDLLRRRLDPAVDSYWIERAPPGPEPETMKQQF